MLHSFAGEGCGMVVLKRYEDALAAGDYVYATIDGWGVSSDGRGAITAPSARGQAMSIARAYAMAGYNMDKVGEASQSMRS